ncbi:MAG: helicase associated domain-containing protein [Clostridia bacterium]|nr:helicase associated domain-containing protein [Clostridia bacterium]
MESENWNKMYNLAVLYYNENGNLLVPNQYVADGNIKLGRWIGTQRKLYREKKLSKEKITLLEEISMVWDLFDLRWNEFYDLAVKYYEENGNLLIPLKYITNGDIHLGYWIGTQRRNYKEKSLSKEKIDLLEEIGMVWDLFDSQWNEYYNLLLDYYNKNGNSIVPIRYITEDNKQLGSWVSHQRRNYKVNKLSKEKIDLLEKIGMVWDPASMIWNETYIIAKQYYEENNNLNIPNDFFYKNVNLGSWVLTQRNNYNQNTLTDSQITMLNDIGMEWDPIRNNEYIWEHNYNTVLEFYKKYKHLYIPINYISKDGIHIGIWLYDQKLKYKKNKLNEYRKNKLDMLDKSWLEPSNTKSSFPEQAVLYYIKKYFPSATKLKTKEISEIDIYIPELKIGVEYDGPAHIRNLKRDIEKSNICKKQGIELIRIRDIECPIIDDDSYKIILKNNSFEALDDGIMELLEYLKISDININIRRDYFEISDNYIKSIDLNWYDMYEKLEEYYNEYGNINVPIYYKTSDGFMLGRWLSNIRNSVKHPSANGMRLNSNKIELLERLGIDWSPIETQWEKMYNLAKEYYNENGNLLIPDKYTTKENIKLGRWIGTQRGNYKKNILSKEKIELLEKIGMVWNLRKVK